MDAVKLVQRYFPDVKTVKDADQPILVEVTNRDTKSAKVKNHKACAMAVACKRMTHADGVIVSVQTAYIIHGDKALRFNLPESVAREVVSFDREAGFAPGEYHMNPPSPSRKLGSRTGSPKDKSTGNGKPIKRVHKTEGIRTVLGSKGD